MNTKFLQPILQGSCGSQRVNCTRDVFFNLKKINFLIFPIKPSIIMGNFLSVGSQSWLSSSNVDVFSLGFFFVYFVQNKPSNLPFISLMLWVEVNLGIFPYKRRNQINLFPIKIDGCFFFSLLFSIFMVNLQLSEYIYGSSLRNQKFKGTTLHYSALLIIKFDVQYSLQGDICKFHN